MVLWVCEFGCVEGLEFVGICVPFDCFRVGSVSGMFVVNGVENIFVF